MKEHAVVIAGAGPTGLMLAAELALAGVDVAIVERRPNQEVDGLRAGGLHSRTIEVLDQRGIANRFLSQGQLHKAVRFHISLDISDFPTRHNYVLALHQNHIERTLAGWVEELAVPIYRGREITSFSQDDLGVEIELSGGEFLRAHYLVGCDGGRSRIRKAAGIDFPGFDPTTSWLIAEAEWSTEPEWGFRHDALGTHALGKAENAATLRLVLTEKNVEHAGEPTLRDVKDALLAIYGTDFGIHNPTWISRFSDVTRQAAAYRDRRVLLAGDAAHIHPPVGGQGLNIGVQDAVNLGWKLAQVVKHVSPATLLDTYHAERHPVAARVLRNTMAQVALRRPDERSKALSGYFSELLAMHQSRKRIAAEIAGLDIQYDCGKGHPLLGRRMPDLDLVSNGSTVRVFTLLHHARPVFLNLAEPATFDISPWADRVQLVDARYDGEWTLPALGEIPAPKAVLIRPDGYVAWVADQDQVALSEALHTWFGAPSVAECTESERASESVSGRGRHPTHK